LSASTSLTGDAKSISELIKKVLKLDNDVQSSAKLLNQTEQINCLYELDRVLDITYEQLSALLDLVALSELMEDANDQSQVNQTIGMVLTFRLDSFALNRKTVLRQGAACSQSALVNGYAHQLTSLIDEATDIFGSIKQRAK
jgi:hypothetical protein